MRLVTAVKQPLIGILGLPRSGTTILANLLNSCENGFCVVEPIWAAESIGAETHSHRKTGTLVTKPSAQTPAKLKEIITSHGHDFGGIKETYRSHEPFCADPLLQQCDFLIFSFREPAANFSSWKRMGWRGLYDSVDFFVSNYTRLASIATSIPKPSAIIIHEQFCLDAMGHFNRRVLPFGRLEGHFQLTGAESVTSFGDERAAASTEVTPSNRVRSAMLSEATSVSAALSGLYNSLLYTSRE